MGFQTDLLDFFSSLEGDGEMDLCTREVRMSVGQCSLRLLRQDNIASLLTI